MRRLARHAFTALAALSLLLCVAVCVLWVRSASPSRQDAPDELSILMPTAPDAGSIPPAGGSSC
jgi:hypothetical protein